MAEYESHGVPRGSGDRKQELILLVTRIYLHARELLWSSFAGNVSNLSDHCQMQSMNNLVMAGKLCRERNL